MIKSEPRPICLRNSTPWSPLLCSHVWPFICLKFYHVKHLGMSKKWPLFAVNTEKYTFCHGNYFLVAYLYSVPCKQLTYKGQICNCFFFTCACSQWTSAFCCKCFNEEINVTAIWLMVDWINLSTFTTLSFAKQIPFLAFLYVNNQIGNLSLLPYWLKFVEVF